MSLQIFERIVGFFGDAGGAFCDISVLILLLLPLATFAAYFPLLLCIGKVRQTSRVWYLVGGDVCLFLLLALYLCRGDLQDAAPVLALFLCAKVVYLLLYGAVCLVPAQKREKNKKEAPPPRRGGRGALCSAARFRERSAPPAEGALLFGGCARLCG